MTFTPRPTGPGTLNGFLDRGCVVTGEVRFEDTLRLDGRLVGTIASSHTLVIGESGEVEGDIDVGSVSINGRVKGTVRALERIEIHAGGRVEGTLIAPVLVVEEGAVLEGEVSMTAGRIAEASAIGAASRAAVAGGSGDRKVVPMSPGGRRE